MQPSPSEFPTPEESKVHKSAATRRKKEQITLSRKVADTSTPEELVDLIMEIVRKHYRRGDKLIRFSVNIPVANFADWAQKSGVASKDMDQYDNTAIRQSLTRTTRLTIPELLKPGSIFRLECTQVTNKLDFRIHLKVSDK
jgi:hypothetical protein